MVAMLKGLNNIRPLKCMLLWFLCLVFASLSGTPTPRFTGDFWQAKLAALRFHAVDNALSTGSLVMSFLFFALGIHNCLRPPRHR
jgi:hypothetical protein